MSTVNTRVIVKDGDVDAALSIFKRRIESSELLKKHRERRFYKKPSVKRQEQMKKAKFQAYLDAKTNKRELV